MDFLKRNGIWAIPIVILLLITPFSGAIDLFVAKLTFYRGETESSDHPCGFFSTPFFDFIYLYGVLPAQVISVLAALCLILSRWVIRLRPFQQACAVLSLTLCIGSGLITNTVLKEFWGRPRPRQITEFGGTQAFRAYYQPLFHKAPEPSKSFPSGHSTSGFYFFCLYFLGKRYGYTILSRSSLAFSFLLGGVLSLARIVQGGHFISDILISALIMWLTAYLVDYLAFDAPFVARFRKATS